MITIRSRGDFKKANSLLEKYLEVGHLGILDKYGKEGVAILSEATPKRTGKTAASWVYKIERSPGQVAIVWDNTNTVNTRGQQVSVAILLEYGHGTKGGGFVKGREFIKPAIQPFFDQLANEVWEGIVNKK